MVRALGPSEYGIVVFIGSIIAILESFVDFGVSSAAGKNIAAVRDNRTTALRVEVLRWARLQAVVASIGLVPLLGITYLIAVRSPEIAFNFQLLVILVFAAWITISLNFVRASLTSLLVFKALAALDTFESLLRSTSFIAVAYLMPSAFGLAITGLVTAGASSALGIAILWRMMQRAHRPTTPAGADFSRPEIAFSIGCMIKESMSFLWLRFATRTFQSIPLIMFGRLFGSEVVGIVGAFAKIVELVNFPFSVIGNALAVRASGVVARGSKAVQALWDAASRFIAASLMPSATIYLGAEMVAQLLLRESRDAGAFLAILSVTVITTAISAVIAPMSDYVGALRSRNILLTVFTFLQVPLIWIGAKTVGAMGAIVAYVLVLTLMNCGYVIIALNAFFQATRYHLRSEVRYFMAIVAAALLLAFFLHKAPGLDHLPVLQPFNVALFDITIFWSAVLVGLLSHSAARAFFFSSAFFDFQTSNK